MSKFPAISKLSRNQPQIIFSLPLLLSTNSMLQITFLLLQHILHFQLFLFMLLFQPKTEVENSGEPCFFWPTFKKLSQHLKVVIFSINIRMSTSFFFFFFF